MQSELMDRFITADKAQRNADMSQDRLILNLRWPKLLKSECREKAACLSACCGEGKIAVLYWNPSSMGKNYQMWQWCQVSS